MLIACVVAMLAAFGGDEERSGGPPRSSASAAVKQPVLLNTFEVFRTENYPYWALQLDQEGTVGIEMSIDAGGRLDGCFARRHSGSEILDFETCRLVAEFGAFAPARDRRGRAVAGSLRKTVTWRLEDREPVRVEDYSIRVVFTIGANKQVESCRVEGAQDGDLDPRTCKEISAAMDAGINVGLAIYQVHDWSRWRIVFETAQFASESSGATMLGKRPGEQLIDRALFRLAIGSDGAVKRCATLEPGGSTPKMLETACQRAFKTPFEASTIAERQVTFVSAVYLRKR